MFETKVREGTFMNISYGLLWHNTLWFHFWMSGCGLQRKVMQPVSWKARYCSISWEAGRTPGGRCPGAPNELVRPCKQCQSVQFLEWFRAFWEENNNHTPTQRQGQTGHLTFRSNAKWTGPFLAYLYCLHLFAYVLLFYDHYLANNGGPQGKKWVRNAKADFWSQSAKHTHVCVINSTIDHLPVLNDEVVNQRVTL